MAYVSVPTPSTVYHYTKRTNLPSILLDKKIRRFDDRECWFSTSLADSLQLMRETVMQEGKGFYKVDGTIGHYPKFVPEDYVILELCPRSQTGKWVRWMQELPPGAPEELRQRAYAFSMLKVGFRGDLKFIGRPNVIEVAPLLQAGPAQEDPKQDFGPTLKG
mgnify:FL=1